MLRRVTILRSQDETCIVLWIFGVSMHSFAEVQVAERLSSQRPWFVPQQDILRLDAVFSLLCTGGAALNMCSYQRQARLLDEVAERELR